jgi:hypothetical protein
MSLPRSRKDKTTFGNLVEHVDSEALDNVFLKIEGFFSSSSNSSEWSTCETFWPCRNASRYDFSQPLNP